MKELGLAFLACCQLLSLAYPLIQALPVLGTSEKMWINYDRITSVVQKGKKVSMPVCLCCRPCCILN